MDNAPKTDRDTGFRWPRLPREGEIPAWLGGLLLLIAGLIALLTGGAALVLTFRLFLLAIGAEETQSQLDDQLRNIAFFLAAVLGAPFVLWRAIVAQKQVDVAEQGMITDRITKAVEQLGAEKETSWVKETPRFQKQDGEWLRDQDENPIPATRPDGTEIVDTEVLKRTVPNIEVRLGGIYALERIAQDSERDHIQIMEILCSYIRENSTGHTPTDEQPRARLRTDIAAAMDVLGRRSAQGIRREEARGFMLDLRGVDMRWRILQPLALARANLQSARFEAADLQGARLKGAWLKWARFESTNLGGVQLQGADLRQVMFDDTTHLRVTNFESAAIGSVDLSQARRTGDDFKDRLAEAFGDGSVMVPADWGWDKYETGRPAHWPLEVLDDAEFERRWRAWQKETGFEPPGDD